MGSWLPGLLVSLVLGLPATVAAVLTYRAATRANRAAAEKKRRRAAIEDRKVDAAAFETAQLRPQGNPTHGCQLHNQSWRCRHQSLTAILPEIARQGHDLAPGHALSRGATNESMPSDPAPLVEVVGPVTLGGNGLISFEEARIQGHWRERYLCIDRRRAYELGNGCGTCERQQHPKRRQADRPAQRPHPQAGLDAADVVTEELVEGSIARFFVTFQSHDSPLVGPVRSARPVDAALLRQLGGGLFAYAGAAQGEIGPVKAYSKAVPPGPDQAPGAYWRSASRPAPTTCTRRLPALPGRGPARRPPRTASCPVPLHNASAGRARPVRAVAVPFSPHADYVASWRWDQRRPAGTDTKAASGPRRRVGPA